MYVRACVGGCERGAGCFAFLFEWARRAGGGVVAFCLSWGKEGGGRGILMQHGARIPTQMLVGVGVGVQSGVAHQLPGGSMS